MDFTSISPHSKRENANPGSHVHGPGICIYIRQKTTGIYAFKPRTFPSAAAQPFPS